MERTRTTVAASNKMTEMERITQENQVNSPLLRLPAELRMEVYKYALTDGRLVLGEFHCSGLPNGSNPRGARALLYTCRQIHYEAAPLVFHCCVFEKFDEDVFMSARQSADVFPQGHIESYRLSRAHLTQVKYLRHSGLKPLGPWPSEWLSLKRLFLETGTEWTIEQAEMRFRWLFGREDLEILWADEE